jgi:hypothetical protein
LGGGAAPISPLNAVTRGRGNFQMPSKEYFRNLAQMSRRVSRNMTDPAIAQRLLAIGDEFELQAAAAPDSDPSDDLAPPGAPNHGSHGRT